MTSPTKRPDDATSHDAPTGGRYGPRGGRWASQEREDEHDTGRDFEPDPVWDNVIRAMEDATAGID